MIDEITDHFEAFFVDAEEDGALPPAMLNACQLGLQTVNKYYSLMDESILYCLAIREFFSFNFPSFAGVLY